jgi:hypothetical protein
MTSVSDLRQAARGGATLSRGAAHRRGRMHRRRPCRRGPRQGDAGVEIRLAVAFLPAELDLLPDHHRRLGRGHGRRLHRTRHDPDAGLFHGQPRALDGRLDASGDPRHRAAGRHARALRAAQRAQAGRVALRGARLAARRRAGDGVLPRRAQHRPRARDRAAHGPLGPARRRAAGLFHERRRRIRPHHRRHLRFRRGAGAGDRRHPARGRRGPDRAQPPPRASRCGWPTRSSISSG